MMAQRVRYTQRVQSITQSACTVCLYVIGRDFTFLLKSFSSYLAINNVILATANVLCNTAISHSHSQDREFNVLYLSVM